MKLIKLTLWLTAILSPLCSWSQSKTVYWEAQWMPWWSHFADGPNVSRQNVQVLYMFPDTHVVSLHADTNGEARQEWVNWCKVGRSVDPKSDIWSQTWGMDSWWFFDIDYFQIDYSYQRQNPDSSIIDTLVVQLQNHEQCPFYFTETGAAKSPVALPLRECVPPPHKVQEYKLLLGPNDTTLGPEVTDTFLDFKSITLTRNLFDRHHSEIFAITTEFRPGQVYNFGDTLFIDSALLDSGYTYPKRLLNRFGILASVQDSAKKLDSYNNGIFVTKSNRYGDPETMPDSLKGRYQSNFFQKDSHEVAYFPHIGVLFVMGSADVAYPGSLSQFQLYPMPVNETVQLHLEMTESNRLDVNVYDISGRKVMHLELGHLAQGTHHIPIDIAHLSSGLYSLELEGETVSLTRKLIVNH